MPSRGQKRPAAAEGGPEVQREPDGLVPLVARRRRRRVARARREVREARAFVRREDVSQEEGALDARDVLAAHVSVRVPRQRGPERRVS